MLHKGFEVHSFKTPKQWQSWLAKHHADPKGIWIKFYKKGSNIASVTYQEALDIALCYGWIDSLVNKYDEASYLQKFTPRGKRSRWSRINRGKVEQFIKEGKMKPSGLAAVAIAKENGEWAKAYSQ